MRIKVKIAVCSGCDLEKKIYNKGKNLCITCNTKRLQKQSRERQKKKIEQGKALDYTKLNKFYKYFWDLQNEKVCYETGEKLYTFNKWHVHHLLEKNNFMEAAYDVDNCVLLTLQQHSLWHGLSDKERQEQMPKTYDRYLKIKEKYGHTN